MVSILREGLRERGQCFNLNVRMSRIKIDRVERRALSVKRNDIGKSMDIFSEDSKWEIKIFSL